MIYFTSDLHLNHNKEFVYKKRNFDSIEEMNYTIIENWNNTVNDDDDIYVLGDLMLGDIDCGIELIKQLKGHIHIIIGNHDSDNRIERYREITDDIKYATIIQYKKDNKKYCFYLSHYPTLCANTQTSHITENLINLFGHTHQETSFFNDCPFMYNVGCDAHNCHLVSIEDIIEEIKQKVLR